MSRKRWVLSMAAAAAFPSVGSPSAEGPYGTRERPLAGPRHAILLSLAHQLDESAQGALDGARRDGAGDDARDRASSAARVLPSIRSFATSASDLRARLDSYDVMPFEVPPHVDALVVRAEALSEGIRASATLDGTYADWDSVLGILARMQEVLAGGEREALSVYATDALTAGRLQEFRQLARDVDVVAAVAVVTAEDQVGDYPDRGRQYLGELRYCAARSRNLRRMAEAPQVDPQQVGPIVDRLLEEARLGDRSMRDAGVFSSVWAGSGSTITMLQRMAGLVRP